MRHWTLDDIPWDAFDPSQVDPELLRAVKAAALVEGNADDYVRYLKNVFGDDAEFCGAAEQWGIEENQHGAALARWARSGLGLAPGAVLFANDGYGRGIREIFEREYTGLQGVITESNPYLGAPPELGPYLDRIARAGTAQFALVAGYVDEAWLALAGLRERGVDIPVIGGDGLEGMEAYGEMADGTYVTSAYFPDIATEGNRRYISAYRTRYPDLPPPNGGGVYAYTALYMLKDIIEDVGDGRPAIRDALAELGRGRPAFEGPMGPVAFDERGDLVNARVFVGEVRGGRMRMVEDR